MVVALIAVGAVEMNHRRREIILTGLTDEENLDIVWSKYKWRRNELWEKEDDEKGRVERGRLSLSFLCVGSPVVCFSLIISFLSVLH